MLIARIENDAVAEYPLYISDIRSRFNPTTFPANFTAAYLPWGYKEVIRTPEPTLTRWQTQSEDTPVLTNGEWRQVWVINDLPLTLAEKKAQIVQEIDRHAKHLRDEVVENISPAEMASWPIKRTEALAYQADNTTTVPSLSMEAAARGVTVAVLAEKVLAKATLLSALEAAIAGKCGALSDTANAAIDEASLLAININSGWPEITQGE